MKSMGRALAIALAASAALVAGCGGDDDEGGGETAAGEQRPAQPSRLAIEVTGSAKQPRFSVPASVEGGVVTIELTNAAEGPHGAQLVTADPGHSPQEALAAGNAWADKGKPLPDWAHPAGGVGDVEPGETRSVTQELLPGSYVVADTNTGASAAFEVTEGSASVELPADGGTIEATEYAFESRGLTPGRKQVLFDNPGREPHLIAALGLKPGKTVADARRFFETEKGEPPLDQGRSFSTAVIEGGERQSIEADLQPGKYVLLCFVPDRKGGPPHTVKGMISEAVVGG